MKHPVEWSLAAQGPGGYAPAMSRSTQFGVGAAALAGAVLFLAGCSAPSTDDASPGPAAKATSQPSSPAPDPTESSPPLAPTDVTFEAGAELDPAEWTAGWTDVLMATDERFTVTTPDDGNGSWAYLDTQTQCAIAFYQGAITDLELGADDRQSTDNMLAAVLGAQIPGVTGADVSANASDGHVAQSTQAGTVDIRVIVGTSGSDATWSEFGRMFGTLGTALVVNIDCPAGQDASTEVTDLLNAYLAIAVSPTAE